MPANKPKRNKKHQPKPAVSPLFVIERKKLRSNGLDSGGIASMVLPLFARIDEIKRGEVTEKGLTDFLSSTVFFDAIVVQAWPEAGPEARAELQRIRHCTNDAVDAIDGIFQRFDRTGRLGANADQLRALGEFAQACEHLLTYNNLHVIEMARLMYERRLVELNKRLESSTQEDKQTHAAPHQRARANGHSSHPVKNGCAGL